MIESESLEKKRPDRIEKYNLFWFGEKNVFIRMLIWQSWVKFFYKCIGLVCDVRLNFGDQAHR